MKHETSRQYRDKMTPLLEKFKKSEEVLTNEELKVLLKHFVTLEKLLYAGGERFHFVWHDTRDQAERLKGMEYLRSIRYRR